MDADATTLRDERWLALIRAWRGECLRAGGESAAAATAMRFWLEQAKAEVKQVG